jgi:hypothetical protein
MWTPSDRCARAGRRRAWQACRRGAALLAFTLALAVPSRGSAQPGSPPSRPAAVALAAGDRRELRQSVERRYQVAGVHNGVLLKPRVEKLGVREVEVSGDAIVVNGARVSPEVLQSWIGDAEAAPLLRLLDLPPADRQALFNFKRDVAATLPGAAAATPPGAAAASGAHGAPPASPAPPGPQAAPASPEEGTQLEHPGQPERTEGSERPERPEPPEPPEAPLAPTAPMPPTPPSPPSPPPVSSGDRVRIGGPITVEKHEVAEDVVAIGGSVHIDGEVNRDVSAVGGSVRVNGRVGGDVTSVGGSVHLGPHSEVMGDVRAVAGTVTREPGAVVHGSLSDVGSLMPGGGDEDWDGGWLMLAPVGRSLHVFWSLAVLVLLLLAVTLVVLLAPRALEQVRARVAGEPWTAAAAGVLSQILAGPALGALVVLLIISIVGCLLLVLIPFLILALMIAALVGFAGVAYQVGRMLEGRFGSRSGGAYLTTMIGVLAIEAPSLIGHLLAAGGGFLHVFALMFLFFGLILRYIAWTVGFGAALLTAFANRPQRFRRHAPPSVAPAVQTPPALEAAPPAAPGGGLS